MPSPRARPRPSLRARLALAAVAVAAALGAIELVLHAAPRLLPSWYRERFPPNGIEFERPGQLDATPLHAVPLPYGADPFDGPPPHDLVRLGIAPASAAARDREATPRFVVPVDADGLPNRGPVARADVVLVGDSFAVFAAQQQPPGLQCQLEQELGANVLNLGIAGVGPVNEAWLLEHRGLPAAPRLVLWLFFGGNDVVDTLWLQVWRAQGMRTWGDLHAVRRAPRWIVPSLLWALCTPAPAPALVEAPLPGLPLATAPDRLLWFHPDCVRLAAVDRATLLANPGWLGALDAVRTAHAQARAAGAQFLLVFVPSKEQVHLPHVTATAEVLHRYAGASRLIAVPMPTDPKALLVALLANRALVEASLREFCAGAGIPMWSAAPVLEDMAASGDSGYYATDTHWNAHGQRAAGALLVQHLRREGLWQ